MSAYRVEIENTGHDLCPWRYRAWDPSGTLIGTSNVFNKAYAEQLARGVIDRDKKRRASLTSFEVPA